MMSWGPIFRPQLDIVKFVGKMPWEFVQVIWLQVPESSGLLYLDIKLHLAFYNSLEAEVV